MSFVQVPWEKVLSVFFFSKEENETLERLIVSLVLWQCFLLLHCKKEAVHRRCLTTYLIVGHKTSKFWFGLWRCVRSTLEDPRGYQKFASLSLSRCIIINSRDNEDSLRFETKEGDSRFGLKTDSFLSYFLSAILKTETHPRRKQ